MEIIYESYLLSRRVDYYYLAFWRRSNWIDRIMLAKKNNFAITQEMLL